jgi:hypothetical protein
MRAYIAEQEQLIQAAESQQEALFDSQELLF